MRHSVPIVTMVAFAALATLHRAAADPPPTQGPSCAVVGHVSSSDTALPGVELTLLLPDGTAAASTSSAPNGAYRLAAPGAGTYRIQSTFTGFTDLVREVSLTADSCSASVDLVLILRPRALAPVQQPPTSRPAPEAQPPSAPVPPGGSAPGGAPSGARQPGSRFREVGALSSFAGSGGAREPGTEATDAGAQSLLPAGFSADAASESVALAGGQVQTVDGLLFRDRMAFLDQVGGDLDALAQRMTEGRLPGGMGPGEGSTGAPGGFGSDRAPGGGGFSGGGGFPGGPGGMGPGGSGGMGRGNRIQGALSYTFGGAPLDAAPYPLNGTAEKLDYLQHRLSANVGGPLRIPGVYDGTSRTSFFLSYNGSHADTPRDLYSTVPTQAQRDGDLSSLGQIIVDPTSGLPFDGAAIPTSRIDPSSRALLEFLPLPNQDGTTRNFHHTTVTSNVSDQFSLRLTHGFGSQVSDRSASGRGASQGGGAFGRGGFGRRRPTLTVGLTYRKNSGSEATSFPTLVGLSRGSSWDLPVSFSFSRGRASHQLRFGWNRNSAEGRNLYADVRDVAGEAGIGGVATDPFDWGVPNVSFTTFTGLRDPTPSSRLNERLSFGETTTLVWKRHTLRVGGELRTQRLDSQLDTNPRGSFVFTGLHTSTVTDGVPVAGTGLDFADFLLGFPQQASVQFGEDRSRFRSRSMSLFAQDDWRLRSNLTMNLGLRYEYVAPFTEENGRLVNLDVAPGFTAAAPVMVGEQGAFTGSFPDSLVYGDTNNLAPRVGLAWKPRPGLTVRTGYGINYNLGAYGSIAQSLANQPPFAVTSTTTGTQAQPLTLADAFSPVSPDTTTNSYGIDKHYELGTVQLWNLDVQLESGRQWLFTLAYAGTRGTALDMERAPNRGPVGLRIPDVQAFLWQSSEATSILHAGTARIRKRMSRGFAFGASYTFAKSLDNASSMGGGTMVVAQNDQDLAAERGRSSFDRRHSLAADAFVELPFGVGRHWLTSGWLASALGGWTWSGALTLQSGTPFTARVSGDIADVSRGVNGTLRANVTGLPSELDDPTVDGWFDTEAFELPPPGAFGDAGRNTITGPGTFLVNMGLTRNISLGRPRTLSLRLQANNVLNTPNFTSIDTVLNSPTYGEVVQVGSMRTIQLQARVRF